MTVFGPLIGAPMVEKAVASFLRSPAADGQPTWPSIYLGEIERLLGYQQRQIMRATDAISRSQFDTFPEDQLPVYLVICPGLSGRPVRRASSWEARWGVGIGVIASDQTEEWTRELAQAHALAVRASMLQHKSLGGFAQDLVWADESDRDIPFADSRTVAGSQVVFEVVVENVVSEHAGPVVLPSTEGPVVVPGDPLPEWPPASAPTVTVQPRPLTGSLT